MFAELLHHISYYQLRLYQYTFYVMEILRKKSSPGFFWPPGFGGQASEFRQIVQHGGYLQRLKIPPLRPPWNPKNSLDFPYDQGLY